MILLVLFQNKKSKTMAVKVTCQSGKQRMTQQASLYLTAKGWRGITAPPAFLHRIPTFDHKRHFCNSKYLFISNAQISTLFFTTTMTGTPSGHNANLETVILQSSDQVQQRVCT